MKAFFISVISLVILILIGGILFAYSGVIDVAATTKDNAVFKWLVSTTREASIERRSEDVIPPDEKTLSSPETLRTGFEHYNEMCVGCHGAPGISASEARAGLNPKPPLLVKMADKVSVREMYWVIKHGIRMTGMPAWGPTHSDDKIWAMVAFVRTLPTLSPEQYKAMQANSGHSDHAH